MFLCQVLEKKKTSFLKGTSPLKILSHFYLIISHCYRLFKYEISCGNSSTLSVRAREEMLLHFFCVAAIRLSKAS